MKIIAAIVGVAFLIIAGVMISIVRSGSALRAAGVIKPAEIGKDPAFIGKQIAIRLFPDFDAAKYVVWRIEDGAEALMEIPSTVLSNLRVHAKPSLYDLRTDAQVKCGEDCWYIQNLSAPLPESIAQKIRDESVVEIFVQYFNRELAVPEACEREKILTVECMKPVAVREVRRKIKTSAPHYFMQRYQRSQFYLFVEN